MDVVAVIPAKSTSKRVPDKNFKPIQAGLSLLELKIINLQLAGVPRIVVSSDDRRAEVISKNYGVEFQSRPPVLCDDTVVLKHLFSFCLSGLENNLVYWAHPTSPFVSPATITRALEVAQKFPEHCTLGVQELRDFFWTSDEPINYDPHQQPRSQDLPPVYRVTGGIHISTGNAFCKMGAVSFQPAHFIYLSLLESIDIDTAEEWDIAAALAAGMK